MFAKVLINNTKRPGYVFMYAYQGRLKFKFYNIDPDIYSLVYCIKNIHSNFNVTGFTCFKGYSISSLF